MSCFLCRKCFSARGPGFFSREIRVATNSIFFFRARLKPFVIWSELEQHLAALAEAGLRSWAFSLQNQLTAEKAAAPYAALGCPRTAAGLRAAAGTSSWAGQGQGLRLNGLYSPHPLGQDDLGWFCLEDTKLQARPGWNCLLITWNMETQLDLGPYTGYLLRPTGTGERGISFRFQPQPTTRHRPATQTVGLIHLEHDLYFCSLAILCSLQQSQKQIICLNREEIRSDKAAAFRFSVLFRTGGKTFRGCKSLAQFQCNRVYGLQQLRDNRDQLPGKYSIGVN